LRQFRARDQCLCEVVPRVSGFENSLCLGNVLHSDSGCLGSEAFGEQPMRQSFHVLIPFGPASSKHLVDQRPRGSKLTPTQVALGEAKGWGHSDVVQARPVEPGDSFRQLGNAGIEPAGFDLTISVEDFGKGDVVGQRIERKGIFAIAQPAFDVALENVGRPEAIQAHDFEAAIGPSR
jgi:hypothetical protein